MAKIFCDNYNGIMDGLIAHYGKMGLITDNPHDADIYLTWQDVRGTHAALAKEFRRLGKSVIVYQHGRGATRDYGPPNSFPLHADKIMVWGEAERLRLLKYGIADERIAVVGCPLLPRLQPKAQGRHGINVLLVPIIAEGETPENLLVYSELKIWESRKLQQWLAENSEKLKKGWAYQDNHFKVVNGVKRLWSSEVIPKLPRNITYSKGLINVKLTGIHDQHQYMAPSAITQQGEANHIGQLVDLLANTDVMVCLEEGTMQLLACALDIPVILVDIFKYGTYGGTKDYDKVEKIATSAVYRLRGINDLGKTLDYALEHPQQKREDRIRVCELEGGAHLGDINANAVHVIDSFLGAKSLIKV